MLEEIASEHADKLTIAKMDIDANPSTPRNYKIMSIPTMILFSGGKPVKQIVGAKPKAALLARPGRLPELICTRCAEQWPGSSSRQATDYPGTRPVRRGDP